MPETFECGQLIALLKSLVRIVMVLTPYHYRFRDIQFFMR